MISSTELKIKELLRERGWTTKVLAEKTGMSESYLTHIKNGTRRWNEDALKKLARAFDTKPIDLFALRRKRTDNIENKIELPKDSKVDFRVNIVPVVGIIPSNPSPYNNQLAQVTSGFEDVFVPVFNNNDDSIFCLSLENNLMAPTFIKGDYLVISPDKLTRSGDISAVEYSVDEEIVRAIVQVNYMDEFIVLESVNHKQAPIALVRGKDHFRIIGRVIFRFQKLV